MKNPIKMGWFRGTPISGNLLIVNVSIENWDYPLVNVDIIMEKSPLSMGTSSIPVCHFQSQTVFTSFPRVFVGNPVVHLGNLIGIHEGGRLERWIIFDPAHGLVGWNHSWDPFWNLRSQLGCFHWTIIYNVSTSVFFHCNVCLPEGRWPRWIVNSFPTISSLHVSPVAYCWLYITPVL